MSDESRGFACELDAADLRKRSADWSDVMTHAAAGARTEGGFRILFSSQVEDQVRQLVESERACCSWATWALEAGPEGLVLNVTGPSEPTDALAAAFGL